MLKAALGSLWCHYMQNNTLSDIQDNSSCVYSECNTINESEDILKTYNYKVISIKVFLNIMAMFLD